MDEVTFHCPQKEIKTGLDMNHFAQSQAYHDIMTFILQLNRAMFPLKASDHSVRVWMLDSPPPFSPVVSALRNLLSSISKITDEIPPDQGLQRFGNLAFRTWYARLEQQIDVLLSQYLPSKVTIAACQELRCYLLGSFGSAQRLDYGSGHELSFLAFLGGMWKLGAFSGPPGQCERELIIGVFSQYLELIRRLILTYRLEPAGSHGVWGLDDHSFLPYILGSAQYGAPLEIQAPVAGEGSWSDAPDPGAVVKSAEVQRLRGSSLYFGAIGFIYDVKRGPFWEHSRVLFDISGVRAGWAKINKGMLKMYAAEVLGKFPVVQHFPFGALFSWKLHPRASLSALVDVAPPSQKLNPPRPGFVGTAAPWAHSIKPDLVDPMDMPKNV